MQTKEVLLSGDFRYAYRRFGDPEAPAIILLMGLGMSMDAWPESLISGLLVQRSLNNAINKIVDLVDFPFPTERNGVLVTFCQPTFDMVAKLVL